jgi:transcriptional regulator with XRE-family HTH domain
MRAASFRQQFGRSLKAAREAHGLTQRALADAADIAEKYVSRIELGLASPSVDVGSRLARALGVSLDLLADAAPPPDPPEVTEISMLLRSSPPEDRARALRVLRELLK